jgi:calcineurin-like phosphoesterase family protein
MITDHIWVWADPHLGHSNIIKHCHRPFSSVKEMDNTLVRNYNSVVGERDDVFILGDVFGWIEQERMLRIRNRLNGNIALVEGNHDRDGACKIPHAWKWIKQMYRLNLKDPKVQFFMCHYPLKSWSGSHKGSILLHGHCHGSLPEDPYTLSFDVGVDCNNFFPVNLTTILERVNEKLRNRAKLAPWPCKFGHEHATCEEAWACMMKTQ